MVVKKEVNDVEMRTVCADTYTGVSSGKSVYGVICPFCNRKVYIQAWSASSIGKKCLCKAVICGNTAKRKIQKGVVYDLFIFSTDNDDLSGRYEVLRGGKVFKILHVEFGHTFKVPAEIFYKMVLQGKVLKLSI